MHPADRIAMSAWTHSTRLCDRSATASPFWRPRARRPRASSSTVSPACRHVRVCQRPSRLNCWAGRLPLSSTRLQNIRASVSCAMPHLREGQQDQGFTEGIMIPLTHRNKYRLRSLTRRVTLLLEIEGSPHSIREETDMTDVTKAQELYAQLAGKTIEAMALWAEANQRVLRELVELGSTTAKESVRLYGDLQRAGLESLREGQAWTLRWQGGWKDASDPDRKSVV